MGRDDAGRDHWVHGPIPWGDVWVVHGDAVVRHEDLGDRPREEWYQFVSERCGWDVRSDDVSDLDLIQMEANA